MAKARETSALADAAARRRALIDHETSLFVEAGAGSGKTALMAGRIALMLTNGVHPRDIVAITFTEAAAAELFERIERFVSELVRGSIPPELTLAFPGGLSPIQKKAIETGATQLDAITCATIHGFCQQLIRPYPIEAGIDPGARIIDPAAADLAYRDLMMAWLGARFGRNRGEDGLGRIPRLEDLGGEDDFFAELLAGDPDDVVALVEDMAQFLRDKRGAHAPRVRFDAAVIAFLSDAIGKFSVWYVRCGVAEEATAAICADLDRLKREIGAGKREISGREMARLLLHTPPDCRHGQELRFKNWSNKGRWQRAATAAGHGKARGEQLSNDGQARYERCSEAYKAFVAALADAAAARFVAEFDLLGTLYRDYKRQAALLDFDDLLHYARDLVSHHEPVRLALARRYPRILVDEFQDTDLLQAEILWWLCGEGDPSKPWTERRLRPGSLFIVGDPKQAIYRFRGADVDTYLEAKRALLARDPHALVEITANFRSLPAILKFVNGRFRPMLATDRGQPGFAALTETRQAIGENLAVARFSVEIGDRHKDEKERLVVSLVRREEAQVVAELVRSLIGSYPVWDREAKALRPCRAGDIALLAPTGTELWMFERALDDRGIPLASQAGKGFFRRQEVQDLIAIARTVADARDTLAFGALLRGPLIGLTEEEIADAIGALPLGENGAPGRLYLHTDRASVVHPILGRALEIVQNLARKARTSVPYQLMAEAIEEFNVRPTLRARHPRAAERALANVELFLEMARSYDVRGLQAFVAGLRRNWDEGDKQIEGRPDAESEAVSITTIHSAKGLEWPIVIPINSMTGPHENGKFLHRRHDNTVHFRLFGHQPSEYAQVKQEESAQVERERVRLWYVAATRACDLLLLPHQSERSGNDWMSLVDLDVATLPVFAHGAPALRAPAVGGEGGENRQDAATWERETAAIAATRRSVTWKAPSRHEDADRQPEPQEDEIVLTEPAEGALEPSRSAFHRGTIQGGRERGLVLHKLIEEILTGETAEAEAASPAEGPHPQELAVTVLRALALPEVMALRPRLLPEMTVLSTETEGARTTFVGGVADAVAYEENGHISAIIDWKSDVDPAPAQVELYREQIHDYLKTTRAAEGLLVFITTSRVVRVSADPARTAQ